MWWALGCLRWAPSADALQQLLDRTLPPRPTSAGAAGQEARRQPTGRRRGEAAGGDGGVAGTVLTVAAAGVASDLNAGELAMVLCGMGRLGIRLPKVRIVTLCLECACQSGQYGQLLLRLNRG